MTEKYRPTHYAILQDGDGNPPYPVAREQGEADGVFAARIAGIVLDSMVEDQLHTALASVVEADHGNEDAALIEDVRGAMHVISTIEERFS